MPTVMQEERVASSPQKINRERDLTVKVVSSKTAQKPGDEICIKYKKAFDLLKDK